MQVFKSFWTLGLTLVSTVSGCVSISGFTSLVFVPEGIRS